MLDIETTKRINYLINLLSTIEGDSFYLSLERKELSNKLKNNNDILIKKYPLFQAAETVLTYIEKENILLKEIKIPA